MHGPTCIFWAHLTPVSRQHREVIRSGNANFVGIAHLRPLFMFFKPGCYLFEVYFMVEKLLMAGVVGMWI